MPAGWRRSPAGAGAGVGRDEREIGRDDQRRLARHRELVGAVALEQAGRAAPRQGEAKDDEGKELAHH
jgi:hypothetical protein